MLFCTYMQVGETPPKPNRKRKPALPKPQKTADDSHSNDLPPIPTACKLCGLEQEFIYYGKEKCELGVKQRFHGKQCEQTFVLNEEGFDRVGSDPDMICLAINLKCDGLSFRKIARRISEHYHLEKSVDHTTVLKWWKKYMLLIKNYMDTIVPRLSGVWHADEMMVNVKNTEPIKVGRKGKYGNYSWLWNLMSTEERFIIASVISKHKEIADARRLFAEGKAHTKTKPSKLITDSLRAYVKAFKREFYTNTIPRPIHVQYASIQRNPHNNKIERLHNSKRENLKNTRGLYNDESAQFHADAERINHNHIRPHMGLNGKTPAEAAGIHLGLGKDRIRGLINQGAIASKLAPDEKFKAALGKRLEKVVVIYEESCIKVRPKHLMPSKEWKEITKILQTFNFLWVSNGKGSYWVKEKTTMLPMDRLDTYF